MTDFEKGLVLAWHEEKVPNREIGRRLKRAEGTIRAFLLRIAQSKTIQRKPGTGANRKTTPRADRAIVREVRKDPRTSAKQIKAALSLKHLSEKSIRRRLREVGFKGGWSNKKPFISEANRRKRLNWCHEHKNWTVEQWGRVLWSDESPYTVRGSTRFRVWRLPNDRYQPKVTKATLKHSAKIMVWGAFCASGVGHFHRIHGKMDQQVYRQILISHMVPSARKLFANNSWVFQQDNDPKHTAKTVKQYLTNKKINVLPWPAQSPDLNPIENLWAIIEYRLQNRVCSSEEELFALLKSEWEKLDTSLLRTLAESMPHRIAAVIANRGFATKY